MGQAKATLALGKGLVTQARQSVNEVERSAKATLTTTRKEAAKAAEAVVDAVDVDVKVDTAKAKKAVSTSAKRTTTAAKRTNTTAKKAATRKASQMALEPLTAAFLDRVLSTAGQSLVNHDGYLPLPPGALQKTRQALGLPPLAPAMMK